MHKLALELLLGYPQVQCQHSALCNCFGPVHTSEGHPVYYLRQRSCGGSVIHHVRLSVCLSVSLSVCMCVCQQVSQKKLLTDLNQILCNDRPSTKDQFDRFWN